MAGIREQSRAETTARILASARAQIASGGAASLSMRAVARDVDLVSSAVFRYFPTREALLTQLIIESYGHLAEAVEAAVEHIDPASTADRWRAACRAAHGWASSNPHEFQLVYGTPVPDYQAPAETVPAAAAVAAPFLRIVASRSADERLPAPWAVPAGEPPGEVVATTVAELAQLIGFLSLELAGHFHGVVTDTEAFLGQVVERQVATLGLA